MTPRPTVPSVEALAAPAASPDVTVLLNSAVGGNHDAADQLLPLVYSSLRALAEDLFRQERSGHTLQPTALVHEAYARLVRQECITWRSRAQFFVIASKAMRNILVDHARARVRQKRGGDERRERVALDDAALSHSAQPPDLLALDDALARLAQIDARKARLVELRFFGGLSADDAADALGIARSTAAEDWRLARAWLHRELRNGA